MSDRGRRPVALGALLLAANPVTASVAIAQESDGPLLRPGDIVVANIGDNSVSAFDGMSGRFRGYVVSPSTRPDLLNPTGVAFGPDGHLYVSSSGNGLILRFDGASGDPLGVAVRDRRLERPFSLAFLEGGDLLVSAGNAVLRFGTDGAFVGYAARDTSLMQPIGLAVGRDGLLYVANSGRRTVSRFDPETGRMVDVFASDSLVFPSDVAFGADGDLYVSSAGARRVVRFDGHTGAFVAAVVDLPEPGVPVGLAFDLEGRLVIGDFAGSRLFRWKREAKGVESLALLSNRGLTRPENLAVKPRR